MGLRGQLVGGAGDSLAEDGWQELLHAVFKLCIRDGLSPKPPCLCTMEQWDTARYVVDQWCEERGIERSWLRRRVMACDAGEADAGLVSRQTLKRKIASCAADNSMLR